MPPRSAPLLTLRRHSVGAKTDIEQEMATVMVCAYTQLIDVAGAVEVEHAPPRQIEGISREAVRVSRESQPAPLVRVQHARRPAELPLASTQMG